MDNTATSDGVIAHRTLNAPSARIAAIHASAGRDTDPADIHASLGRGQVVLDTRLLRQLRQSRLLSQQDLADECWRRKIRVSIATIKRAECGRAVRFRIAHELARCFDLPVMRIVRSVPGAVAEPAPAAVATSAWNPAELIPG